MPDKENAKRFTGKKKCGVVRRGNGFSHDLAERKPKYSNREFCSYRLLSLQKNYFTIKIFLIFIIKLLKIRKMICFLLTFSIKLLFLQTRYLLVFSFLIKSLQNSIAISILSFSFVSKKIFFSFILYFFLKSSEID